MPRALTALALLLLSTASSEAAFGTVPEGPAAEAIRAWFTSQKPSSCWAANLKGERCSLGPSSTFDVRYHPNGDSALVFVVHPAAIADDRPGMDVAVFREVGEGWRWIKNADPAQGREIGNIRFEGNTAYYSTCSDGWIGYRCLDGARYRDLDLGR